MAGQTTVLCNLPNGLLMRTYKETQVEQLILGGGMRMVKEFTPDGRQFKVNGNQFPRGGGSYPRYEIVDGGYAMTRVPTDFYEAWLRQHDRTLLVENECIMGFEKESDARAWAKEHSKQKMGLEPLDRTKDARAPKPMKGRHVAEITIAEVA